MTISIKCDCCGNNAEIHILPRKYSQLRDELNAKQFYFGKKDSKSEEVLVECKNCRNWIMLGTN